MDGDSHGAMDGASGSAASTSAQGASGSAELPSSRGASGSLRMLLAKKKGDSEGIHLWKGNPAHERWDVPDGQILIIGEEVFAQSLAAAITENPDISSGIRYTEPFPTIPHKTPSWISLTRPIREGFSEIESRFSSERIMMARSCGSSSAF